MISSRDGSVKLELQEGIDDSSVLSSLFSLSENIKDEERTSLDKFDCAHSA